MNRIRTIYITIFYVTLFITIAYAMMPKVNEVDLYNICSTREMGSENDRKCDNLINSYIKSFLEKEVSEIEKRTDVHLNLCSHDLRLNEQYCSSDFIFSLCKRVNGILESDDFSVSDYLKYMDVNGVSLESFFKEGKTSVQKIIKNLNIEVCSEPIKAKDKNKS